MLNMNLLRVLSIVVYFLYNLYALHFAGTILVRFVKNFWALSGLAIVNTIMLFGANAMNVPYYITYSMGLVALACEFYFLSKSRFIQAYFGASTFIVNIVSVQLMVVSLMSIFLNRPPMDMHTVPDLFSINILITFGACGAMLVLLQTMLTSEILNIVSNDKEQSILVSLIATFIIAYSLLDSIIYSIPGVFPNFPQTVIAIQIMSLLVYYILLWHALKISKLNHYKTRKTYLERTLQENIKAEEKLKRLIFKDNLTGCYSKVYAMEYIQRLQGEKKSNFCIVYIDLDGLKAVNDRCGHNAGDHYLLVTSQCIAHSIRDNDVFARMGGDEFLLVLDCCTEADALLTLRRIQSNLRYIQTKEEKNAYSMSLSYGVLHVDQKLLNFPAQKLLDMADKRMYEQKQNKRKAQ